MSDVNEPQAAQQVLVPDFVVREIGALHLQLAVANDQINQQAAELAALKSTLPPRGDSSGAPVP